MSFAIAQGGLPCAASRPAVRRGSRVAVSQSQKQQPHSTACETSKGGVHSGVVSVKQALLAASASVPGVWAAAAFAAENDAATDALRPLDYLILAIPMVAYGLFYVYREQKDVRGQVGEGSDSRLFLTNCFSTHSAPGVQKVSAGDAGGEAACACCRAGEEGGPSAASAASAAPPRVQRPRHAHQDRLGRL